jgi:hypothetical protein
MNKLSPDVIKVNWDEDVKPTVGVCHIFDQFFFLHTAGIAYDSN